jgi:hypothetical protein
MLARLLDTAIGVPGTRVRLGLDAVLGLIPGAGDTAAALLSGYIVLTAVKKGAPRAVVLRMLANVGIDTLVGSVPVLGDLFDVAYKSNIRNVELLERYSAEPARVTARSRGLEAMVVAAVVLLVTAVGLLAFLAVRLAWHALTG